MLPGFVPVARASAVPPGTLSWGAVDGARVVVANVDGAFYVLADACGHQRASLSKGRLEGHALECPLHFARFDVRTGRLLDGPASADVPTYEVRVDDDTVYARRQSRP